MLLCAIGVYGVAAYSARTRRRELAIRSALGARRQDLSILMLRGELKPIVGGIALGLAGALLGGPIVCATPFDVGADAIIYAGVGVGLLAIATLASYLPIRRATATNPGDALHL